MKINEIIKSLKNISELMGSGLFQLDGETEEEMIREGVINYDVDTLENNLDLLIGFLNHIELLFIKKGA